MNPATSTGCESITTWLEEIVIVFAFISSASDSSSFGEIMRSLPAITNQDGLFLHAAVVIGAPNAAPAVGPLGRKQNLSFRFGKVRTEVLKNSLR